MTTANRSTSQGRLDSLAVDNSRPGAQADFRPEMQMGNPIDYRMGTFQNISQGPEWFQSFIGNQQAQQPGRWSDIYNQYAPQLMGSYAQYGDSLYNPWFQQQGMMDFNPFEGGDIRRRGQRTQRGDWEGSAIYGERNDQTINYHQDFNPWTGQQMGGYFGGKQHFLGDSNQFPGREIPGQNFPPPDFLRDY